MAEKPGTVSEMGVSKKVGFYGGNGNFGIESRNSMSVTVQESQTPWASITVVLLLHFFHHVRRGPNTPADSMHGLK